MVKAWPAMTLLKTEVLYPHLPPGHRAYFAAADLQDEKGASAYCQKLQASSLACVEKKNYHFFLFLWILCIFKESLLFAKRTQLNNSVISS